MVSFSVCPLGLALPWLVESFPLFLLPLLEVSAELAAFTPPALEPATAFMVSVLLPMVFEEVSPLPLLQAVNEAEMSATPAIYFNVFMIVL